MEGSTFLRVIPKQPILARFFSLYDSLSCLASNLWCILSGEISCGSGLNEKKKEENMAD